MNDKILDKQYWKEYDKTRLFIIEQAAKPRKKKKKSTFDLRKDRFRESSGVVFTGKYRFVGR